MGVPQQTIFVGSVDCGKIGFMNGAAETEWIIAKAEELGFDLCGIASVEGLADPAHLQEWLARGYAGRMQYMHDPRRADVKQVLPEARSIIVCALNYNTAAPASTEAAAQAADQGLHGWISRYAWGDDYHVVMGKQLELLLESMRVHFSGPWHARAYVDTGPINERQAAQQAGLGWQAKNTCLINETLGSWMFLGVIVTSLELAPSAAAPAAPAADLCGNCRLCLDACPTEALVEPYVMDARRCISYLTIELRESIPEELRAPMGWQVFGCDICQDVCPWNRKAPIASNASFQPREKLLAPELGWLLSLKQEEFGHLFASSPVRRTKWRGLIRNACIAAGNLAGQSPAKSCERLQLRERLSELAESSDPLIAEHAVWAIAQCRAKDCGATFKPSDTETFGASE
jgi:epoxyqueuosine reductase